MITSSNFMKFSLALLATSTLFATSTQKQGLKSNYQMVYNQAPQIAETFEEMFSKGEFYGRLRTHNFLYQWEEKTAKQDSHLITGVGGSLIFKTATLHDIDFTAGLYFSQAFFDETANPTGTLKSGKDTVSRFDYTNTGNKAMGVVGQAYMRYSGVYKTELLLGRQMFETFYTKSNDSKMIPNTFDGAVIYSKAIPDTKVKLGHLVQQKLRDHTQGHGVLTYGDTNSSDASNAKWIGNDDAAMHKGLTATRLLAANVSVNAPLFVGDIRNESIKNLTLDMAAYSVPSLVSEIMTEANYKIAIGKVKIIPGVRYVKQFDNGAGAIGGAAYSGAVAGQTGASGGYLNADSVDAQMIAARLVAKVANYKVNVGYTNVLDEADLITPWRGFPTGGYTRSMARYNWMANTQSYRVELTYNANKTGIYRDVFIQMSVMHTNADEAKGYYDEQYYYIGFVHNILASKNLQWRLRLGYADSEKVGGNNFDGRFELNYLF